MTYPILEFDPGEGVIKPLDGVESKAPERCVLCFFPEAIAGAGGRVIATLKSEIGPNPVYEIEAGGERLALLHPGVGAPLAAAFLDEAIALGCRKFIVCGAAGVLDREIGFGGVVVVSGAAWDDRGWKEDLSPRERLFRVAVESCLAL